MNRMNIVGIHVEVLLKIYQINHGPNSYWNSTPVSILHIDSFHSHAFYRDRHMDIL